MMGRVLVFAVLGVAAGFLLLTLVVLLGKAAREIRDGSRRARRQLLEPLVLRYAHGADASIVAVAGGSLGKADRVVVELILLDHVARVRGIEHERICRALDELGFVDRFLEDLHGRSWWKRARAAEKLGLAGAKRATPQLAAALEDDVAEVRLRAAKALGLVGGRAAVAPLIRALGEPNRWSTIRIADILAAMGRDVVSELMEAFPDQNTYAKLAALDILGRIHALTAVPWLIALLADRERDVRARAAHALGAIGAAEAAPQLRSALTDREWPVRAMAAKALGLVRDAAAIPALCAALRDREWWVRSNAGAALRLMGPKGVEALEAMLQDADPFAQHQACLALEDAGILDRRVAQLAASGLLGSAAESIVTRFVKAGRVGRLHELARSHQEPAVREVLGRILPREGAPGAAR
jgi:HEAT repeat protein